MSIGDARVPLPRQEELPEEYQYLLSEDALGERNVLCAIGNNPSLLQAYMRYGTALWEDAGISSVDLEFVILVVARTLESRYEWQQHVELGRSVGLSLETIRAIGREEWSSFDDRKRAMVSYVRAFLDRSVSEADYEALETFFDPSTVVGIGMVAAHYLATATLLDAWNVPLEGEFVGWRPE
jgi:alkylhydroperoxidase family enzyme